MTKREEVAKDLAEQLGCEIVYVTLWRGRTEFDTVTIPRHIVDALISREMRVRELEESLQAIADVAPGNGDVCELIARRARLALNSKGEKPT